ncbi:MAG: N-acetylmuramoyl-L-alanine amidase [Odoribacter sp.]|nr:N-acetylmuramoyl-L-alanine amidase [Odoribacter sp.]
MEILKHRLVDGGVEHLVCPKNKRKLESPDLIVVHYTAGVSARSSAEYLARDGVDASAHVVIGRDGKVFQLVPFDTEAWHAGRSSYAGRSGLNRCSIGIELDNLGRLEWRGGRFVAECGVEVPPREVYVDETGAAPTFWHRYPDIQRKRLLELCRLLCRYYPVRAIVGHSDITPRKQDPGPALRLGEAVNEKGFEAIKSIIV